MRKVFLFISVSFICFSVSSQVNDTTNDWALVQKTLNLYIEGQATGDSAMVASSFHESWQLKYFDQDKFNIVTKSKYIVGYKKHPKSPNWSGRIVFIDITNASAVAKVEISTSKLLFTDYFNLMKMNDVWLIVDKISARTPHKTIEAPASK